MRIADHYEQGSMSDAVESKVLFAIPFNHDVYIDQDVLGLSVDTQIDQRAAVVQFPGSPHGGRALLSPSSAANDLEHYLPDKVWGIHSHPGIVSITAALVEVPINAVLQFDIDMAQAGGPLIRELQQGGIGLVGLLQLLDLGHDSAAAQSGRVRSKGRQ